MKIREIIQEYNFYGRTCTKDCSGHRAGWYWAKKKAVTNDTQCSSRSPSFTGGCQTALSQQKLQHPRIRGAGGRFVSTQSPNS